MAKETKKPAKQYGCCSGCLLAVICLGLVVIFAPKGDHPPATRHTLPSSDATTHLSVMPEIVAFLGSHPEFGKPTSTQDVPNWANGKRQRVNFDSGRSLLFYEKEGSVVTVYEDDPSEGRKKIWGEHER